MTPIRVLALSPVPEEGASARFRVYQYIPLLETEGLRVTVSPFYTAELFRILYRRGRYLAKAGHFLWQAARRWRLLHRASDYDLFLVHREVLPVGPPLIERALSRVKGRALVYDFDDAIYLPNVSEANRFVGLLKWPRKVPVVIASSDRVVAGNEHLARYARAYNPAVTVIPTCVDTASFVPRPDADHGVGGHRPDLVVGWIGSPTTRQYLLGLGEALQKVAASRPFRLRVSGAGRAVDLPGVPVDNVPWSLRDEVALFQGCDVGLYPLPDTEWTRGKCGFKAIQFMACGVPVVAAAVGVNRQIIEDGVNGFLAESPREWEEKLAWLLADRALRVRLGRAGRATVEARYSLRGHAGDLARVLREAVAAA